MAAWILLLLQAAGPSCDSGQDACAAFPSPGPEAAVAPPSAPRPEPGRPPEAARAAPRPATAHQVDATPQRVPQPPSATLLFSFAWRDWPFLDFTAEWSLSARVGLAALAGVSSVVDVYGSDPPIERRRWAFPLGLELWGYSGRNFEGARIGLGAGYVLLAGDAAEKPDPVAVFNGGPSFGGLAGYKHGAASGFTLAGDLGLFVMALGESRESSAYLFLRFGIGASL
jgi:hypothetical protein